MASFLVAEREHGGWRFLLLWILATTIGFALGIGIEILITGQPNLFVAVPLSAIGQAYIINRHISIYLPWAVGTSLLWVIGMLISTQILNVMMPRDTVILQIAYLAITAFFAGIFAGLPQMIFMRDWIDRMGFWWVIVNGIASALFFLPGIVSGVILMNLITSQKIPMGGRHYELSGEF